MKKTLQFLSMGLLAALLLARCSAAGRPSGNPGANSTPGGYGASTQAAPAAANTQDSQIPQTGGALATSTTAPPAAAPTAASTPSVGQPTAVSQPTATAIPPTAVLPTAVPPTAVQPTAIAPTAAPPAALPTATPLAAIPAVPAVPAAGSSVCGENRLNELDGIDIYNTSGLKIGEAKGIVVLRDTRTINNPAAAANAAAPQITYLATELDTPMQEDRPVAIPYKAFSPLASVPMGGDCGLILNVPDTVLAQAPVMDVKMMNVTIANWDQQLNTFWAANGFAVPAAGAQMGSPVFLDDNVDDLQILGMNNLILGEVEDIIIDPKTGSLQYVVLKTEDTLILGKRYIPIPISRLAWIPSGLAVANQNLESLRSAPAFTDSDQLKMLPQNWDANVKAFWASNK